MNPAPIAPDCLVSVQDVAKSFRHRPVIETATFQIRRGESVALTGPNGSGKSVLLRLVCGLLRPDQGTVWLSPELMGDGATFPTQIGAVIDRPAFIPHMNGVDNLRALAVIRNVIEDSDICAAMERVGLDPSLQTPVSRYSLGMRQKLALAQAFMENQRMLVLDEPFNGLDRESVSMTHELLESMLAQGRTILFTSHQQGDVRRLAQRRLEISGGRVQEIDVNVD